MTIKTRLAGGVASAALALGAAAPAMAEGELNLLTWEGYADPSFIAPFEEATGCTVSATYVGSNDDFAPRLAAGGGVFDLVSPSSDSTAPLITAGFVDPIDTSRLDRWDELYERFRTSEGINSDGQVYGVPYAWGAIAFMYKPDAFETPPRSLDALMDPALEGKVALWDDKSAIYVAARMNGDMDIYNLSDEQIAAAQETLGEMRSNVRKYWSSAGELVDLFASGEVVLSNTWAGYQSALLAEQGIEVVEFIPEENAEGWMDSWMVVSGTPNEDCAYQFLNMAISEAGQCGVASVNGYSVANPVAARECMTPEQFEALHQDDPAYLDSLLLWENLGPRLGAYTNAWNAVKSQ
ncbi:ABC transporter substrate-binding protein [Jannaschia aquimarina]|uniref:PotF_1 protein n=1 Tax=Jannaschia aquimarina TaxID=935700 RepID=A0A0D1EJF0_9RHOB|nr:ABC transporter substrate-binding protein [Jannaschia aquimarina]KIT17111.1 Putrescine-binding periplasmic protein precursor [Jannaschia aquimarina]SNS47070.1 putative spermidine/putrescine transport system substrate-binding protein/spermidine/putrescine transport system substrate-binding protein [Jannaschia aquimarina]